LLRALVLTAALACGANAFAADELRTLFHTAEERRELDRLRRGEPPEQAPEQRRRPPVLGGFVKRSDGRATVWLDGKPVTGAEAARLADPTKMRENAREQRGIEFKTSK
jgi:hypothetical protein